MSQVCYPKCLCMKAQTVQTNIDLKLKMSSWFRFIWLSSGALYLWMVKQIDRLTIMPQKLKYRSANLAKLAYRKILSNGIRAWKMGHQHPCWICLNCMKPSWLLMSGRQYICCKHSLISWFSLWLLISSFIKEFSDRKTASRWIENMHI